MTDGEALKVLVEAGAKLLRYWRLPNSEAPHVEGKSPEGLGDWANVSAGRGGASAESCAAWLRGEGCTVDRFKAVVVDRYNAQHPDKRPMEAPASVAPGIGILPASIRRLVVDIDLASKKALADMPGPERQRRAMAGHAAVVAKLGDPDGVQRSPSGGLHCYYPDDGIPEGEAGLTNNATWEIDEGGVKVGGDIRGSNGWVGVYDLPALAKMVQAGHGEPLAVETLRAFVNNPHRKVGARDYKRAYERARAGGAGRGPASVAAACAAIRSAEAGDTYAGRNPTIVYQVARLAKDLLLDGEAAEAVLDAVAEVKPGAVADTERWIGKARDWAADSTGNTGGPPGVRGEARRATADVSGSPSASGGSVATSPGPDRGSGTGEIGEGLDEYSDDLAGELARGADVLTGYRAVQRRPVRSRRMLREALADVLASVAGKAGVGGDETEAAVETFQALQAAYRDGGEDGVCEVLQARDQAGIVFDAMEWDDDPPDREWLVDKWLPAGRIGIVTGKGEGGKSRLVLQLAAVLAGGGDTWIPGYALAANLALKIGTDGQGEPWGKLPVVVATWEDEAAELVRRLKGMEGKGRAVEDRGDVVDNLHHADMSGAGPVWAPAASGSGHTSTMGALTGAGRSLRRFCEEKKARLLIMDPVADAFACSENDRALVSRFLSSWDNWGMNLTAKDEAGKEVPSDCAVLLVSHPSKDSEGNTDYRQSGSTSWHGRSRYIWDLVREKVGKDERPIHKGGKRQGPDDRPGAMRLKVTKSNYLIGLKPDRWLVPHDAGWQAVTEGAARMAAMQGSGGGAGRKRGDKPAGGTTDGSGLD